MLFKMNLLKPLVLIKKLNVTRYFHASWNGCNIQDVSIIEDDNWQANNALQRTCEDLSTITPYFPSTFNLAAYVNKSSTLQTFVHLGINVSKIEKKPFIVEKLLKLNVEDIKDRLMFLKEYVGADDIGKFLTKNSLILCEEVEDLQIRVNYLNSKKFRHSEISRIITKNPFWLMFSTVRIDKRLGFYQEHFKLHGNEVRLLSTKQPNLITYNLQHVKTNSFAIKEEMGFEEKEVKQLLLKKPRLWMIDQRMLLERFKYIHNVIKIPHERILQYPNILLCRNFRVKQRHVFLEKLGRAQYDPTIENFIPLSALVEDTDTEFCKKFAKCHVDDFNLFLKTI